MRSESATAGGGPIRRGSAPQPHVWAVGGGKGGVGKSVVASNLAIAIAAGGARCAVVDADLGGANLHTLLGVPRPPRTLSHFLRGEIVDLQEALCSTSIPNVSLVSGARAFAEMANLKHAQKQKVLRHIRRLPVGHVVLDLGAGSCFNVLDFFLAADRGILVVLPEPTAIENAYHFLKSAFFRSLRVATRHAPVREALEAVVGAARRRGLSPRQLVAAAGEVDPEAGRLLRSRARAFSPLLIVNQVDSGEQRRVGAEMIAASRVHLGIDLEYAGALELDASVPAAVSRQRPVLQLFPGCDFSRSLAAIADRLLQGRYASVEKPAAPRWSRAGNPSLASSGLFDQDEPRPTPAPRVLPRDSVEAMSPVDLAQPGASLRRRREHLGLALAELSRCTRIRRLDGIEAERFAELPPEPYLRAQVLEYARALGIREAEALATSFAARARHRARP
jgi:flagellar biosynthesis protein FlhG